MTTKPPSTHRIYAAAAVACALLIAPSATFAKKGGNGGGGGGGGGGEDPPPNPAPIEYQLTWFPGTHGDTEIHDVNSAGVVVGSYHDASGTKHAFWSTAAGVINDLDNWWTLPPGWRMGRGDKQINESNQVCGFIVDDANGDVALFLADLDDSESLEAIVGVASNAQLPRMNESGDIAWTGSNGPQLYVRSLDLVVAIPGEGNELTTGINDNLQVSLISWRNDGNNGFDGSVRYTFDPVSQTGVLEDLASTLPGGSITLARDITDAGSCVGFYYSNERRNRDRKAKAGVADGGTLVWGELDAALPKGGDIWIPTNGATMLTPAASGLRANEFGQVLGGYDVRNYLQGTDLWLLDPEDGLLQVDDLVTAPDAVATDFRNWTWFWRVEISEVEPVTGYGIIVGSLAPDSSSSHNGFILTPVPVQP